MDKRFFPTRVLTRIAIAYTVFVVGIVFLRPVLEGFNGVIACALNFTPFFFIPALPLCVITLPFNRRAFLIACVPVVLGIVLFAGYFTTRALPPHGERALSLLSHNISNKSFSMETLVDFVLQQDADVVTMQEIPYESPRQERILAAIGDAYPHYRLQPTRDGVSANLTLSRYPILASEDSDDSNSLYTRLCVAGRIVALYNISYDTPVADGSRPGTGVTLLDLALSYDDRQRNAEIDAFLTLLDGVTEPLIAAGDFNMSDQTTRYASLAARLTDSYREAGQGFGFTWPVSGARGIPRETLLPPVLRIDYVWHNAAFVSLSAETVQGVQSDHLAVKTALAWNVEAAFSECADPETVQP